MISPDFWPLCESCHDASLSLFCDSCSRSLSMSPFVCPWCLEAETKNFLACVRCQRRGQSAQVFSSFRFEKGVRSWVTRIKSQSHSCSWRELQREHLPLSLRYAPRFDALSYVPSDPIQTLKRGFHSAKHMGQQISKLLQTPLIDCFRRSEFLQPQRKLDRRQRREMISKSVHYREGSADGFSRILLIDDVMTTGASLLHCLGLLEAAGCSVRAYVIARQGLTKAR